MRGFVASLRVSRKELLSAGITFIAYCVTYGVTHLMLPPYAALYPAAAVGVVCLFFGGWRLWPAVLFASLASGFAFAVPYPHLIAKALSDTLEATSGAWLLQRAAIDPIFRKYTDMFNVLSAGFLVSLFYPTIDGIARLLTGMPDFTTLWKDE